MGSNENEARQDGLTTKLEIYRDALEPLPTNNLPRAWERVKVSAHAPRLQGQKIMKRPEIRARNPRDKENLQQFELESEGMGARKRVRMGREVDVREPKWKRKGLEEWVVGAGVVEDAERERDGGEYIPRKRTNTDRIITPRKGGHAMVGEKGSSMLSEEVQENKEKSPRRRKSMRKSMRRSSVGIMREFGLGAPVEELPDESLNSLDVPVVATKKDSVAAAVPATESTRPEEHQTTVDEQPESVSVTDVQAAHVVPSAEVGTEAMQDTLPTSSFHSDDLKTHSVNHCIFDSITSLADVPTESWAAAETPKTPLGATDDSGKMAVALTTIEPDVPLESIETPKREIEEGVHLAKRQLSPQSPSRQITDDLITSLTPARSRSLSPSKRDRNTPIISKRTRRSIRTPRAASARFGGNNITAKKAVDFRDEKVANPEGTERASMPVEPSPIEPMNLSPTKNDISYQEDSAIPSVVLASIPDLQPIGQSRTSDDEVCETLTTEHENRPSSAAEGPQTPPTSKARHTSVVHTTSQALGGVTQISQPDGPEDDGSSDDSSDLSSAGGFSPIAADDFTLSLSKSYRLEAAKEQEESDTAGDNVTVVENDSDENLPGSSTPDPTTSALIDTISENAPTQPFEHDDTDMLRNFLSRVKANKAAKANTASPKKRKRSLPHSPLQIPLGEPASDISPAKVDDEFDIGPPPSSDSPNKRLKRSNPLPKVDEVRRSGRTRLPVMKSPVAAPSFIPVRTLGQDGDGTVTLRNSEEKERAALTRVNTRKNKGGALSAPALLKKKLAEKEDPVLRQRLLKEVFDDKTKREKKQAKNVAWAEEIAVYQEFEKSKMLKQKPKAALKERKVQLPAEEEVKASELEEREKKGSMRSKSKIALGMAANGTPAPKRRTRG